MLGAGQWGKAKNGSRQISSQQEFTMKCMKKSRPEQMNPSVSFVIFVVQAFALNQTWPFRITAFFLM